MIHSPILFPASYDCGLLSYYTSYIYRIISQRKIVFDNYRTRPYHLLFVVFDLTTIVCADTPVVNNGYHVAGKNAQLN